MQLISFQNFVLIEERQLPAKIFVQAVLITASKKNSLNWLIFDWKDDQIKILNILQKYWELSSDDAMLIYEDIDTLKKTKEPQIITVMHSFKTKNLAIQIMNDDGTGKRMVISFPNNKKLNECKPREKRWIWISNKLDRNTSIIPTKSDPLNLLGCSTVEEREEVIRKLNSFL